MRAIQILQKLASSNSVNIFSTFLSSLVAGPGTATVTYSLNSSGAGTGTGISGWTWLLNGVNSSYDVWADLTAGTLTSGTTGSWLNLGTTRTWSISRSTVGVKQTTITVKIRRTSDLVEIDIGNVVMMEAELT